MVVFTGVTSTFGDVGSDVAADFGSSVAADFIAGTADFATTAGCAVSTVVAGSPTGGSVTTGESVTASTTGSGTCAAGVTFGGAPSMDGSGPKSSVTVEEVSAPPELRTVVFCSASEIDVGCDCDAADGLSTCDGFVAVAASPLTDVPASTVLMLVAELDDELDELDDEDPALESGSATATPWP